MASWTVLPERGIRIPMRATSFNVVCKAHLRAIVGDEYGPTAVRGTLLLEQRGSRVACPHGFHPRAEQDTLF